MTNGGVAGGIWDKLQERITEENSKVLSKSRNLQLATRS